MTTIFRVANGDAYNLDLVWWYDWFAGTNYCDLHFTGVVNPVRLSGPDYQALVTYLSTVIIGIKAPTAPKSSPYDMSTVTIRGGWPSPTGGTTP